MKDQGLKELFGKRLRQARLRAGLSMDDLCEKIGRIVTKQSISKYETGRSMAGENVVSVLATALGVPAKFFTQPFSMDFSKLEISFRHKWEFSAKKEKILALRAIVFSMVEGAMRYEKIFGVETCFKNNLKARKISTAEDAKKLAIDLRQSLSLGNAAILNTKELLRAMGIRVFEIGFEEPIDGTSGTICGNVPFVILNFQENTRERMRFTACHELAHLLANNWFDKSLDKLAIEKLCNVFASEFLLPEKVLVEEFSREGLVFVTELKRVQKLYGISPDAIIYALKNAGLIDYERFCNYFNLKKKNKKLREELEKTEFVEDDCEQESFEAMVAKGLHEKVISEEKAKEFLNHRKDGVGNVLIGF